MCEALFRGIAVEDLGAGPMQSVSGKDVNNAGNAGG